MAGDTHVSFRASSMFAIVRSRVVLVGAMLLFEGCLVPRDPSDRRAEPQVPAEPHAQATAQAPPWLPASNVPYRVGDDPLYKGYVVERRKTHPAGQWQDSPLTKWTDALQGYESRVKPGTQHALNAARSPFGWYLIWILPPD
jgi:hypothetical protein